jgi:integrase
MSATFERIDAGLYRRDGLIYARVRENGKRTWRGTGTDNLATARKLLKKWREEQVLKAHGIETAESSLARNRLTVAKVLDAYIVAGCPTKKMHGKKAQTIERELRCEKIMRAYFGERAAISLTLDDCDKYRDWRNAGGYTITRKGGDGEKVEKRTKGGDRSIDLELIVLNNALRLAVRRRVLKVNPLTGRESYRDTTKIRHCREVAPTPEGLAQIERWLRLRDNHDLADLVCFLAFTGLRIGEALAVDWESVDWREGVLHVKREKSGVNPFVPLLPELEQLLREMQRRSRNHLLFPSPLNPEQPREQCAVNRRITAACKALGLPHVTPHGLRSYFVTQARQSGLTDAEIAMLIGDKTGPAIIAHTYGDVRPDHLLKQAKRIQLRAVALASPADIPVCIPALPRVSARVTMLPTVAKVAQDAHPQVVGDL